MIKRKDDDERVCAYCQNSVPVNNSDAFLCDIKGIVRADGYCRRFVFDLLKINPGRVRIPAENEDTDFSL